ncbi:MAG: response regulator [Deltaproteobacteria bacterium]|nr:response regulator [Deltaproteobacteria bacterium]
MALIVDDDPGNRGEIAAHLKNMNHRYREAGNVSSAKELLAKEKFDYVVLDLCIPMEPENAYTDKTFGKGLLSHILNEFDRRLPVLVVSGVAKDPADIVEIMKLARSEGGLVSYVVKPFNSKGNADISKEIRDLLDEKAKKLTQAPGKNGKRERKPSPDGSDRINLDCKRSGHRQWRIEVNDQPVVIGQKMLNILIQFGRAQRHWKGKKNDRHLAEVDYKAFGIGERGEDSDLSSLLTKIKDRLWPCLKHSIIVGKKGKWKLGATIVNVEKADPHYEP